MRDRHGAAVIQKQLRRWLAEQIGRVNDHGILSAQIADGVPQ